MQDPQSITVIIPTHDHIGRLEDLLNLLNSLVIESNLKYIKEILIIDNGGSISSNNDYNKVIGYEKIKVIKESNIGLNNARNTGVLNASEDIISFLDDDVVVSSSWAENIVLGYLDTTNLCVGGPVFIDNNSNKNYPKWFSNYFSRFIFPPKFPEKRCLIDFPYYLIGANMSFSSAVFKNYGIFDPDLDRKGSNLLSNGDIEFIMRIPKNRVWYEHRAVVTGKIISNRLTRNFMIRRLFWQGISDCIMVQKRGVSNFYDINEVYLNRLFLKNFISRISKKSFFEAFCIIIRLVGFSFGRII